MNAKEYLGRVGLLETRVKHKQMQREEVLTMVESIRSMSFGADGSNGKDAMIRLEQIEEECAEAIAEYCEEKSRIIETIHRINDSIFETVLFKHYVELKSFEQIALETDSTYNQVKRLRPAAEKAFERVLMAS